MKKTILAAALLAIAGISAASAASAAGIGVSVSAVSGNISGFTFQQTPHGMNGGAGAATGSYTGVQIGADADLGPVLVGGYAMKSASGLDVDEAGLSASWPLQVSKQFGLYPGVDLSVQHVDGQSYTRQAADLTAAYNFTPRWAVTGSVSLGRALGGRFGPTMTRGWGDYRSLGAGVGYNAGTAGAFLLTVTDATTQTTDNDSMRKRAVSLTYLRTF